MDTLQLDVTVVTRNTMQLKESTSKPTRLVITTAITTRKCWKREPTTGEEKKLSKTITTSRVISTNKARITYNLSSFQNEARTRPTNRTSRNKTAT